MLGYVKERGRTQPTIEALSRTYAGGSGFSMFVDILARHAIQSLSHRREQTATLSAERDQCQGAEVQASDSGTKCKTSKSTLAIAPSTDTPTSLNTRETLAPAQGGLFD
jgi:hypothetical protein